MDGQDPGARPRNWINFQFPFLAEVKLGQAGLIRVESGGQVEDGSDRKRGEDVLVQRASNFGSCGTRRGLGLRQARRPVG